MLKIIPLYCHKWSCPRCRKTLGDRWRSVALSGDPERFITLTLRADDNATTLHQATLLKRAWPKLLARIRKTFGPFEYLMFWELTRRGTPHVHILQRGAYVGQRWLSQQWCELTGAYIVDVRKIHHRGDVAAYVTKYCSKDMARTHSGLSGLRIVQRSRGWVLEAADLDGSSTTQTDCGITEWTFLHVRPFEVEAYARGVMDYQAMPRDGADDLTLRGPPQADPVSKLLWGLVLQFHDR